MEETLFESERRVDRAEIADLLRTVADNLEAGEPLGFSDGADSVTVEVPPRPEFEVKVEREGEAGGTELSVELELEWDEDGRDGGGGGDLRVE